MSSEKITVLKREGQTVTLKIEIEQDGVSLVSTVVMDSVKISPDDYECKNISVSRPQVFLNMKEIEKSFDLVADSWLMSATENDLNPLEEVQAESSYPNKKEG